MRGDGAQGCGPLSLTDGWGLSAGPPREAWGWAGRPDHEQGAARHVRQEEAEMHGTWNQATRVTAGGSRGES